MGTIQIKKVEKKVVTCKVGENRQKVTKTYGKIIYRGTLGLNEMAMLSIAEVRERMINDHPLVRRQPTRRKNFL